jgi:hypothetical protein
MFTNEISPGHAPEIIPAQSLWYKGPDGKYYATKEVLIEAGRKLFIEKHRL